MAKLPSYLRQDPKDPLIVHIRVWHPITWWIVAKALVLALVHWIVTREPAERVGGTDDEL